MQVELEDAVKVTTSTVTTLPFFVRLWQHRAIRASCDAFFILATGILCFWGASWQISKHFADVARYQCYATAFWGGEGALKNLPHIQCVFIRYDTYTYFVQQMQARHVPAWLISLAQAQSPDLPLHALPYEYPFLAVFPFSLGLLAPAGWFQVAFALWIGIFAGLLYLLLLRVRSRAAAIALAIYFVCGSWSTLEARFDLFPAAFTLLTVLAAKRNRWVWAYFFLGLATMFKFYPILLLPPLFFTEYLQRQTPRLNWQRWRGLVIYLATCGGILLISLALSIDGTLEPLSYFGTRPIEVESLPGALLWLASLPGAPARFVSSYGSLNILQPLAGAFSLIFDALLLAGLGLTWILQLKRRISFELAFLLTMLVILVTGKILSPQYLIWATPLVAYVGQTRWRWLLPWTVICLLTTWIYPYMYAIPTYTEQVPSLPTFFPVVLARDLLLAGLVAAIFCMALRRPTGRFLKTYAAVFPRSTLCCLTM